MVNHFKSKSNSRPVPGTTRVVSSDTKRRRQATRAAQLYNERKADFDLIAVVGDLNDTPDSTPLRPLFADTDLVDVAHHPKYHPLGGPGTYGTTNDKIDYILCSPDLLCLMSAGGTFRKGVWRSDKARTHKWERFNTLTKPDEAASDHAAVWADFDIS